MGGSISDVPRFRRRCGRARSVLEKALVLVPSSRGRTSFYSVVAAEGAYEDAAQHLRNGFGTVSAGSRAVISWTVFLQRKYPEAVQVLQQVLAIDPEDSSALQP